VNCFVIEPIAKFGFGGILDPPLQVSETISLANQNVVLLSDQNSTHETLVVHIVLDYLLHSLRMTRIALRETGRHKKEGQRKWSQTDVPI